MSRVIVRKGRYEAGLIRPIVHEMLNEIGDRISPGARVLVKPNLLRAAAPETAVLTHPMLVRCVVEYLLDKRARVQVSDSPALGAFDKVIASNGLLESLGGMEVTLKPFGNSAPVDVGPPFGAIELAQEAVDADLIINLAKLKTHTGMILTLGVKNLFGCVVGLRKPDWHMRVGVDRALFAQLLVRIYEALAPAYTIVDGILAMEGQGPGRGGKPRELGLVIGGANAHAVDKTISTLLGMETGQVPTIAQARAMGVFDGQVHVDGDLRIVNDFRFPEQPRICLGPSLFAPFMRRHVIQQPVPDNRLCTNCGECRKICPAKAISGSDRGIVIDAERCIRCYCCIEVCPHGAIRAREPLLGRVWNRYTRSVKGSSDTPKR